MTKLLYTIYILYNSVCDNLDLVYKMSSYIEAIKFLFCCQSGFVSEHMTLKLGLLGLGTHKQNMGSIYN